MSAIFYLKYKGGFLHLHDGLRRVSRVSETRHATPFTSEPCAWHAARKLRLDPDFLEVVNASSLAATQSPSIQTNQPAATVADAAKPAVQSSKLISAAVSVALFLFLSGSATALPGVTRPTIAVNAILGEASNQGARGMLAVACAIRNRCEPHGPGLSGVYGLNNPVVATASPSLRAQAASAWVASGHGPDITCGASFWGTADDVRRNAFYSRLQFTVKIGDHYFFRSATLPTTNLATGHKARSEQRGRQRGGQVVLTETATFTARAERRQCSHSAILQRSEVGGQRSES